MFALTALMSVLWFVAGYTLAFGSSGVEQGPLSAIWGTSFWRKSVWTVLADRFLKRLFVMFQLTFAVITPH